MSSLRNRRISKFFKCTCFSSRGAAQEISKLDFSHRGLREVPGEIFSHERTLEDLSLARNNIDMLKKDLFCCHELRSLNLSDNDFRDIPNPIGYLTNLRVLTVAKNNITEISDNISSCRNLSVFDGSMNPLGKLPEGFTKLLNLTELILNDSFLNLLPGNIGRILELRGNQLKTMPSSCGRLTRLERLDVGGNELSEMPESLGEMSSLLEFWCDDNELTTLPRSVGLLSRLMLLDVSDNHLETLPMELSGCQALGDCLLSRNRIQSLPASFGRLSILSTLKLDNNLLEELPASIGGLVSLSEMSLASNGLTELPATIGLLRHLRILHLDNNQLICVPNELGSCGGLTVLSIRNNLLTQLPDELGRISRLRVLNLSNNKLLSLPYSLTKLKQLQALWLSDNQSQPLVQLQSECDPITGGRTLTCYLLPQMERGVCLDYTEEEEAVDATIATLNAAGDWQDKNARDRQIRFETDSDHEGRSRLPKDAADRHQERRAALKHYNTPVGRLASDQQRGQSRSAVSQGGLTQGANKKYGRFSTTALSDENFNFQSANHSQLARASVSTRDSFAIVDQLLIEPPAQFGDNNNEANHGTRSNSESGSYHIHRSHWRPTRAQAELLWVFGSGPDNEGCPSSAGLKPTVWTPSHQFQMPQRNSKSSRRNGYDSDSAATQFRSGQQLSQARTMQPPTAVGRMQEAVVGWVPGGHRASDVRAAAFAAASARRQPPSSVRSSCSEASQSSYRLQLRSSARRMQMETANGIPQSRWQPSGYSSDLGPQDYQQRRRNHCPQQQTSPPPPAHYQYPLRPSTSIPGSGNGSQDLIPSSSNQQYHQQRRLPLVEPVVGHTINCSRAKHFHDDRPLLRSERSSGVRYPNNGSSPGLQAGPQAGPQTRPQTELQTGLQARPQTELQTGLQARPQTGLQTGLQAGPQAGPQTGPQAGPQAGNSLPGSKKTTTSAGFSSTGPMPAPRRIGKEQQPVDTGTVGHQRQSSSTDSGYSPCHRRQTGGGGAGESLIVGPGGIVPPPPLPNRVNKTSDTQHQPLQPPPPPTRSPPPLRADLTSTAHVQGVLFEGEEADDVGLDNTVTDILLAGGSSLSDNSQPHPQTMQINVTVYRNPGLGFSIVGGVGSTGNPFRQSDSGIFVSKVIYPGPASQLLQGDKIMQVNGIDFEDIEHSHAVSILKASTTKVEMTLERILERISDI